MKVDKNRVTCKHGTIIEFTSDNEMEVIKEVEECDCRPSAFSAAVNNHHTNITTEENVVEILRNYYNVAANSIHPLVEQMDGDRIQSHIVATNRLIAETELLLKKYKAQCAAQIHALEDVNKKRKDKSLAEYEIPTIKKPIVKTLKEPKSTTAKPKVEAKDKPIINLFDKLKNVDSVVKMLSTLGIPEAHIRQVISDYQKG